MQLLNAPPARTPGSAQAGSSQQSTGDFGAGPAQPGARVPEQAASHTAIPPSGAPPATAQTQISATQGPPDPGQSAAVKGRGAMLQKLYDVQVAQQQQQASLSSTPSETSLEAG